MFTTKVMWSLILLVALFGVSYLQALYFRRFGSDIFAKGLAKRRNFIYSIVICTVILVIGCWSFFFGDIFD